MAGTHPLSLLRAIALAQPHSAPKHASFDYSDPANI